MLTENISKTYKRFNLSTMYTINAEAKVIAQDLKIDERIEQYNQKQSFITLKTLVTVRMNEIFPCLACCGQKLNFYVWKSRQR